MTQPRNRRWQPDAGSELDDTQTDVQSPPNVLTPPVAGDAGSELDGAQTDVQPNETDTVPAEEDAQAGAGPAAAETEMDTTDEAPPAENETDESPPDAEAASDEPPVDETEPDTTDDAPPPEADSGADDPPAAESVPGSLEIFTAAEEDELPPCAVCREAITPGQDFVTPAYGPIHTEPCSHQTRRV